MTKQRNSTGCKLLDKAGVTTAEMWKGSAICLECPNPDCVLDRNDDDLQEKEHQTQRETIYVRCLKCGATETLLMTDGRIQKTQKWLQRGDIIYHVALCGMAKEFK